MLRNKTLWIIVAVVVLVGGGYAAYSFCLAPGQEETVETTMQTSTATLGDLSITASGSGTLVPSLEADLAFDASGKVLEVLVEVGDKVQAGDVLAWIDDSTARQDVASAEIQVMNAEQDLALAVAEAELTLAEAEADLTVAQRELDELVNWDPDADEISVAKANLLSAQVSYQNTSAKSNLTDASNTSVRINLDQAIESLADAQQDYAEAMNPERDWEKNIEDTREHASDSLVKAQQNLEIDQANYDLAMVESTSANTSADLQSAWAKVLDAEAALEDVEESPDEEELTAARIKVQGLEISLQRAQLALGEDDEAALREAELALEQAEFAVESAQEDMDGTTLVAPFAGTITEVNVDVGETATDAKTAVVLADLDTPVIQFWVEESDMNNVAVGSVVEIVFEALQDFTYGGEIYQVDPVLVTVSNTPAVQSWATIDTAMHPVTLLGDMNADVEIVSGQALNAVLVPVQALRQIGEEQYSVFVVQPSGELEMRIVEVGLMDYVSAEIISGVEVGEVVSTGETTTSSSSGDSEEAVAPEMAPGAGMMMGGGMGGRP